MMRVVVTITTLSVESQRYPIEYNSNKCQEVIAAAFQRSHNNCTCCDGHADQDGKKIVDFNDKNNNNHSGGMS